MLTGRAVGAQVAPADKRGTLGSVNQLVICFGILGALVVNVILPATDWRTMFYLAAIPPALVILGEASQPSPACICASFNRQHQMYGFCLQVEAQLA